jgi:hypothetical protein
MAFYEPYPSIKNELNNLFSLIQEEVKIIFKSEGEDYFSKIQISPVEMFLCPAAVIYSAKAFHVSNTKEILNRAKVAFYVYMASYLHHHYEREPAASKILCGDYLFARYCAAINESNSTSWLRSFSQIMCRIHENRIRLLLNPIESINCNQNVIEFARKNTGLLLGECCGLGATVASEWTESLPRIKKMGINLGIAFMLTKMKVCSDYQIVYAKKACQDLMRLPRDLEVSYLSEFVNVLFPQFAMPLAPQRVIV